MRVTLLKMVLVSVSFWFIQTTERYLGPEQEIAAAVNDSLHPSGARRRRRPDTDLPFRRDPTPCLPLTLPSKCFVWCYGPEFTSRRMIGWAEDFKVGLVYIQPGRPMQNGHVESFHGRLHDE